ncbi:hypothetical protein HPP92_003202 [Vanilla planifolia]|uniref:Uncharacterized protein n=1 Tax=Vanilla planifolia TaxID=51239 RepID=A0A835S9X5_VANPL|nr:hypothetical protein HPP92_003202 [Vanilla planifolia]
MRQIGQATLSSSFISTSRAVNKDSLANPLKQPISLSEFLNRKVGKSSDRLLQEKRASIGSIGSIGFNKKDLDGNRGDAGNSLSMKGASLQQLRCALKRKDGIDVDDFTAVEEVGVDGLKNELQCPRKRKKQSEFSPGDAVHNPKYLVIVGDDPKPRPRKRKQMAVDKTDKSIYNHYATGHGYWDGDKEGIDYEEVGYNEVWEGVGTTTLGGLDWH